MKIIKLLFAISALLCLSLTSHTQVNTQLTDSLMGIWNNTSLPDSTRFWAASDLCWEYLTSDPEQGLVISQQFLDEAKQQQDSAWIGSFYNTQGNLNLVMGEFDQAIILYEQAIDIFNKIGRDASGPLSNLGTLLVQQGQYGKALENYYTTLAMEEKRGDKKSAMVTRTNIAQIFLEIKELDKAINAYKQALDYYEETGNEAEFANISISYGASLKEAGRVKEALKVYEKSLAIQEEKGNLRGMAMCMSNIALIYAEWEQKDTALALYEKSLEIRRDLNWTDGTASTLIAIGRIHFDKGNLPKSKSMAKEAMDIGVELDSWVLKEGAAKLLYRIYKEEGRPGPALEMHEIYHAALDTMQNERTHRQLLAKEFQYKFGQKAAQDSIKNQAKLDAQEAIKNEEIEAEKKISKEEREKNLYLYVGLAMMAILAFIIFSRFRASQRQKKEISLQKEIIEEQKILVEERQKEIVDSISYAKRIQTAILPSDDVIENNLNQSFILYRPKDIVAGDFYWMEPFTQVSGSKGVLLAAADCTGHGVPGAMVSVVCNNSLNRTVREFGLTEPGKILDKTRDLVIEEFHAGREAGAKNTDDVKDGMDIALISLSGTNLSYAGANNPLWLIRKGGIPEKIKAELPSEMVKVESYGDFTFIEVKANKQPIGQFDQPLPYTTHHIKLQAGDTFYLFSDGYVDQFGGSSNKKFKSKNLKKLLVSVQDKTMQAQHDAILEAFEDWRHNYEQVDDVCIIGVRV